MGSYIDLNRSRWIRFLPDRRSFYEKFKAGAVEKVELPNAGVTEPGPMECPKYKALHASNAVPKKEKNLLRFAENRFSLMAA